MGASWESLQEFSYQDMSQGKMAASLELHQKLPRPFLGSPLGAEGVVGTQTPFPGAVRAWLNLALL